MKHHPRASVSCVLIHQGRVLIVRRSLNDDFLPGYYEFPGGKIEDGESQEQAIKREFLEEVGLRVKPVKFYRNFEYVTKGKVGTDLEFIVELESGESVDNIRLSSEHDEYKFVNYDEAQKISKLTQGKLEGLNQAFLAAKKI